MSETGIFVVNQGSRIDLFKFVTQMWICEGCGFVKDLIFVGRVSCQDDGI